MAFIRIKNIRGRDYAYLVESRWDAARGTSRQITIKYLGPMERLRLDDVPPENRTDKVRAFILQHSAEQEGRRHHLASRLAEGLVRALVGAERKKASALATEATESLGLDAFYVDVLAPAMHRIGELWHEGEISISVEHLASNIAAEIVNDMNAGLRAAARRRGTVALCTPPGEDHNLATKVLEGLLLRRGFTVFNISASAPMDSILGFLEARKPDHVFVSLTMPENVASARRLVKAVRDSAPSARILVGGQGIHGTPPEGFPSGTTFGNSTLAVLDGL